MKRWFAYCAIGLLMGSRQTRPDGFVLTGLVELGATRMALVQGNPSGVALTLIQGIPVDNVMLIDLSAKNRWALIRDGETTRRLTFAGFEAAPEQLLRSRQVTGAKIGELRRLIRQAPQGEIRDYLKKELEFHAADPIDAPK